MAKRFLDTGFLDQKWIRKLTPERKIFLIYLMLKCDNGGIIDLDMEDVEFWIGKKIEKIDFLPNNYLIPIDESGKYFMPKYIEWQYKNLSSEKYITVQARQILEKHGLINSDFTLKLSNIYIKNTKNLHDDHVTDIDIGNGIGIGNGKGKEEEKKKINFPFEDFWNLYDKKVGDKEKIIKKWQALSDQDRASVIKYIPGYIASKPDKQYRKDPATFLNNKSWNDEIIQSIPKQSATRTVKRVNDLWKDEERYKTVKEKVRWK